MVYVEGVLRWWLGRRRRIGFACELSGWQTRDRETLPSWTTDMEAGVRHPADSHQREIEPPVPLLPSSATCDKVAQSAYGAPGGADPKEN